MTSQSSTLAPAHGAISGRSCFKCGNALGQDGMRYLGHDWCRVCARAEAETRLQQRRAGRDEATTNGATAAATALSDLPAAIQSLLAARPNAGGRDLRSLVTVVAIVGGPVLLIVGLGLVLAAPTAMTGPTLTLSGAILTGAVVRRR